MKRMKRSVKSLWSRRAGKDAVFTDGEVARREAKEDELSGISSVNLDVGGKTEGNETEDMTTVKEVATAGQKVHEQPEGARGVVQIEESGTDLYTREETTKAVENMLIAEPTPYHAMLLKLEEHMDAYLECYGKQKVELTRTMEMAFVKAGGNPSLAESKRRHMTSSLESGHIPADVVTERIIGPWKRVATTYRKQRISRLSMDELLRMDHVKMCHWIREAIPPNRNVPLLPGLFSDSAGIKVASCANEGFLYLFNRSEDSINFELEYKSKKFLMFPSCGEIHAFQEQKLFVIRLVDTRTRGSAKLTVKSETCEIIVELKARTRTRMEERRRWKAGHPPAQTPKMPPRHRKWLDLRRRTRRPTTTPK